MTEIGIGIENETRTEIATERIDGVTGIETLTDGSVPEIQTTSLVRTTSVIVIVIVIVTVNETETATDVKKTASVTVTVAVAMSAA